MNHIIRHLIIRRMFSCQYEVLLVLMFSPVARRARAYLSLLLTKATLS